MATEFTFHQLRSFIAVAEEQSVRKAAERLSISQPPLSRQISSLENSLGVPLFERIGRGIVLTFVGEVFLREARTLVEAERRARLLVDEAHSGKLGSIRVGYTEPTAFDLLPHVLSRFRESHPGVDLELHEMHSREGLNQLERRTIDVAYLRPPVESKLVELSVLHPDRLMVALPEKHPLTASEIPLTDLRNDRFISYATSMGSGISSAALQACATAGFAPRIDRYASSVPMLMSLVASGAGVALVAHQYARIPYLGVRFAKLKDEAAQSFIAFAARYGETLGSVGALKRISFEVSAELFGPS